MKENRFRKFIVVICPAAALACILMKEQIAALAVKFPKCLFYAATGYYCTGCGNTRSVLHILEGEFLLSLRCNPAPLILIISALLLYIENVLELLGYSVRLLPRKLWFWLSLVGLYVIWCVVRNFISFLKPV